MQADKTATKPLHRGLETDTIAAIATAPGRGGVGVIRLSGAQSHTIACSLSNRPVLTPRYAHYSTFYGRDQSIIDDGIILYFDGPRSFTGEDVVELQGHGSPVGLSLLLERCLELGARQARPGEFSERAFLNDKMDLVQAEAIADLINAQTRTAVRQAQSSLRGKFSDQIQVINVQLIELRKYVEAAIDFPEEEIDFLSEGRVGQQLHQLITDLEILRNTARQGAIYRSGATVVLAGKPNAGKSSLLNVLAGDQVAIVTDVPGTTRDIVKEYIDIHGVPVHLIDTAGLRDTDDRIEQEGVRRAEQAITNADLAIHLIDDSTEEPSPDLLLGVAPGQPVITVYNKIDLSGRPAGAVKQPSDANTLGISTLTGAGIETLKDVILRQLGIEGDNTSVFSARERHIRAINQTLAILTDAEAHFSRSGAGELLAEDLRLAHDELGTITGRMTSDELLGEIFSSFCIGK